MKYKRFLEHIESLEPLNSAWEHDVLLVNDLFGDTGLGFAEDLIRNNDGWLDFNEHGALVYCVNNSDYFYPATSDYTEVAAHEIFDVAWLYKHHWYVGVNVWCCYKRGELPCGCMDEDFVEVYNDFPKILAELEEKIEKYGVVSYPKKEGDF